MAMHGSVGEFLKEFVNDTVKCCPLFGGEVGFRRFAVFLDPAYKANADGVGIVAGCVSAWLIHRSPGLQRTIAADNAVIADVGPAVVPDVPYADFFCANVHAGSRGRAMNDDLCDVSHVTLQFA